jgi:GntR family transcriptional regulator
MVMGKVRVPMIEFHLDGRSGVATYLQLVQQTKHALRLGLLKPGDQLPTAKQVVAQLAINPNTVLKAYRQLEQEGLVTGRPGLGTFVTRTLASTTTPPASHAALRRRLAAWLTSARRAGLDDDSIVALFQTTFRASASQPASEDLASEDTA